MSRSSPIANFETDFSLSMIALQLEQAYTFTNMEAYSHSTHVDVNVGLPWLEVCSVGNNRQAKLLVPLEERFGINESGTFQTTEYSDATSNSMFSVNLDETNSNPLENPLEIDQKTTTSDEQYGNAHHRYPSYLRSHEPMAFEKSGLLRPVLDKFTFQSTQVFHRPPIHYSTQELVRFMKQGLVVGQNEMAVDDTELHIDLLNFNLDR